MTFKLNRVRGFEAFTPHKGVVWGKLEISAQRSAA